MQLSLQSAFLLDSAETQFLSNQILNTLKMKISISME